MRVLLIVSLLVLKFGISFGQGCSDAGVCTAGSHDSSAGDSTSTTLTIGQTLEMGDRFVFIASTVAQLKIRITSSTNINVKSNYFLAAGDLGAANGLGDVIGSITQRIVANERYIIYLNIGGKIPVNSSNKLAENGRSLPMPYQSSLGTYDIMGGGSIYFEKWRFSIGYQHPFNTNNNGFTYANWEDTPEALRYFESNRFKRGDDFMVRAERLFKKEKSTYSISLLPIYRVQKDEIFKNGEYVPLAGSNQLTLNLNFGLLRKVNEKLSVKLSYASPIWWRKTRADGLTRFFVIYGGLNYSF